MCVYRTCSTRVQTILQHKYEQDRKDRLRCGILGAAMIGQLVCVDNSYIAEINVLPGARILGHKGS